MALRRIIWFNLVFVVALGVYGFVTDEPYWRDNGHAPWLYDYLFWFGLFMNGPSGFGADYLSWLVTRDLDLRFLAQYGFWCVLLWVQWRAYHAAAVWSLGSTWRTLVQYGFSLILMTAAGYGAHEAWIYGHRPVDFCNDPYFWFVRIAGIAAAGLVMIGYRIYLGISAGKKVPG